MEWIALSLAIFGLLRFEEGFDIIAEL